MRAIVLGGTGSGKGTQTAKLSTYLNIINISTGDILRHGMATGTDLGKQAQPYVDRGELVPDELMIQFIQARLLEPDVQTGWILDGYPRTAFQAEELDFLLDKLEQQLDWAIYLKVSQTVMVQRSIERGLPDDRMEVIERRLQNFQENTIPLLDYYSYRSKLLTIDGEQTLDRVTQEILAKINIT